MEIGRTAVGLLLSAVILGGCGGGGGGGGTNAAVANTPPPATPVPSPPVSQNPPPPELVPGPVVLQPPIGILRVEGGSAPLEVMMEEGASTSFSVTAAAMQVSTDTASMGVVDSKGLVKQNGQSFFDGVEFNTSVLTSPTLAPGEHETTLELRVCRDDPQICAKPVMGSPWRVPVKIRVGAKGKLTTLEKIPGLQPWNTYNGNAGHTGFVAADFKPASFTLRWSLPGEDARWAHPPVLDSGKVFLTRLRKDGIWEVLAIDEASGEILWRWSPESYVQLNPPAAGFGGVYFTALDGEKRTFWVISQINGRPMLQSPIPTPATGYSIPPISAFLPPTVVGNMVYAGIGAGVTAKFNAQTDGFEWTNSNLPRFGEWTPAVDANYAYVFLDKSLYALQTSDGGIAYEIADQVTAPVTGLPLTPVVGEGKAFVLNPPHLLAFDLQTRTRAWTTLIGNSAQPALGAGALYVLNDTSHLQALDPVTGKRLWQSFRLMSAMSDKVDRVIVSNNLAFLVGWNHTVVVDLATRQVVWTYPLGGQPAISERGVLYIASNKGRLDAINLR